METPLELQDRSHLGVIQDPTIKIQPGKKLQEFLKLNPDYNNREKDNPYLSIGDIKAFYHEVIKKQQGVYLNEILGDSEIILPSLVIPPRNPELDERIRKLKKSLAQKEYNRMTQDVDTSTRYKPTDTIGYQMKQINSGLIGVFQFIISVGAAFLFGFMGIEVFSSSSFELSVKLLLGIISALVVACAELYVLLRTIDFAENPKSNTTQRHNLETPSKST